MSERIERGIETSESEVTTAETLVTEREKERQEALAHNAESDSDLSDVRGKCEVKQHELDKQLEPGDPRQQLSERIAHHNDAISKWQRYFDGLDERQLACLHSARPLPEMQPLVFEQLLTALQLAADSDFQSMDSGAFETPEDSPISADRPTGSRLESAHGSDDDLPVQVHQSLDSPRSFPVLLGASKAASNVAQAQIENQLQQIGNAIEFLDRQLEATERDTTEAANSMHTLQGELRKVAGPAIEEELAQADEELRRLQKQNEELEADFDAWKYLGDLLIETDARNSSHLGRQLAQPVQQAFLELTEDRYGELVLSPEMNVASIAAGGDSRKPEDMSVGTRDQLATLIRLTLAARLQTVLVLDDQLTFSDTRRMQWFRQRVLSSSIDNKHQIIVITCRPDDYVDLSQSDDVAVIDLVERIRSIDTEGELLE